MVIFNSYVKLPEGTQQSTTDLQRYDNVRNFCSFLLDANPQSFIFPSSHQKKTSSHTHTSKKILYKYINIIISDMHSVYIYIYISIPSSPQRWFPTSFALRRSVVLLAPEQRLGHGADHLHRLRGLVSLQDRLQPAATAHATGKGKGGWG